MKNIFNRSIMTAALVVSAAFHLHAQKSATASVQERNVRAQMQFLAGDAMQGRGSGTPFERIAAEYVGSQFMQFGLEPVGENNGSAQSAYVQTATRVRTVFEEATLTIGTKVLQHRKDMLVMRVNAGSVSGTLQKLESGGTPAVGAAVFVGVPDVRPGGTVTQAVRGVAEAGAAIVIVEEPAGFRDNWNSIGARLPSYSASPTSKPLVIIIVSKDAAAEIASLAEGTNVVFGGRTRESVQYSWNAIGKITGTDTALGSEVILLSSHLDHLGVRENAPGDDKIFNGADDDASGTVAVLELARAIANGPRPKRTVYFVCFGSEESGGIGAGYFVNDLPFPKEKLVANLEFEMIGRPDAKVKPEELWLTGYERSDLGAELAKRGAKLVQDPHPEENFFQRSDNYTLARQGIIAHTVSSFGLHTDYHKASDEVKTIDFAHMTRSISSMIAPIQWLVNSAFRPSWVEGKKP